jgi:hypothetical protein
MRLLVFAAVGFLAWIAAYAFALGGTIGVLIFLFILFNGILDRWIQPLLQRLRP